VASSSGHPDGAVSTIALDYPVRPRSRFGWGRPGHPQLEALLETGRARYAAHLDALLEHAAALRAIPAELPDADPGPRWRNLFLPGLDAAALYAFVARRRPRTYIEVGSGNSTSFARRAVEDHGLATRIVSIDPHPRAEIDAICDEVVRAPLEDCDLDRFAALGAGDVVFVDNSHRLLPNSDATVTFLEVLPRLAPGVLLQLHDIWLPDDYPDAWNDRFYSEQYALATFLLGGAAGWTVELPCWFVSRDPELSGRVAPLFEDPRLDAVERHGGSFWMERAPLS